MVWFAIPLFAHIACVLLCTAARNGCKCTVHRQTHLTAGNIKDTCQRHRLISPHPYCLLCLNGVAVTSRDFVEAHSHGQAHVPRVHLIVAKWTDHKRSSYFCILIIVRCLLRYSTLQSSPVQYSTVQQNTVQQCTIRTLQVCFESYTSWLALKQTGRTAGNCSCLVYAVMALLYRRLCCGRKKRIEQPTTLFDHLLLQQQGIQ